MIAPELYPDPLDEAYPVEAPLYHATTEPPDQGGGKASVPAPTQATAAPPRRLYEIGQDFLAFEALLLETGGEFTPEVEALQAELEGNLEHKVESYCGLVREWELEAAKWKAEETRVGAHRRTLENAVAGLKRRLVGELVAMGREKIETPRFKVAVQRACETLALLDPDRVPERFVVEETVRSIDKKTLLETLVKIREGYELGDWIEGDGIGADLAGVAEIAPGTPYLRIR